MKPAPFLIRLLLLLTAGLAFQGKWAAAQTQEIFSSTNLLPPTNGAYYCEPVGVGRSVRELHADQPLASPNNVAGLGSTNVTFVLTNSTAGAFSVEFTTNLTDWLFLGPATPRYEFTDTNAPASPQRSYRLRWP